MSKSPLKIYRSHKHVTPAKAGVMMFEDTDKGRKLLVAYNEGRFAKNGKYIVLPKGSIDAGESAVRGGMREFGEETGFHLVAQPKKNIEGFFTEAQIQALERGEVLEHVVNPRYRGFEIIRCDPAAFMHQYHARSGDTHWLAMFGIKVKGLDSIVPHLKNAEGKTTKDFLDANKAIPRFPKFFSWLKRGVIPADGDLPAVPLCDVDWFAAKEEHYVKNGIVVPGETKTAWQATRENWQNFCTAMENDKDYPKLRACFHTIKERMEAKGFVQGDNAPLKFDEKDNPLFWYTEGVYLDDDGKIPLARPVITKVLTDMDTNVDYARAFGGHANKHNLFALHEILQLGQVAGFSPFVSPQDWRGACIDTETPGRVGKALAMTGKGVSGRFKPTRAMASGQIAAPESPQSARR